MTAIRLMREAVTRQVAARAPFAFVRFDDGWITLEGAVRQRPATVTLWDALLLNGRFPGPAKLVLPPGGSKLEIRADIPADEGLDVTGRVGLACDGLRVLAAAAAADPEDAASTSGAPAGVAVQDVRRAATSGPAGAQEGRSPGDPDLPALAAEAGWPFVLRSPQRLAIDLEAPGQFQQAMVERGAGGLRARASLVVARSLSARSRAAVGVLLLAVAGLVRLVRSGVDEHDGEATVFVEVNLCADLVAAELHHALSALAVACHLAGREARVLLDEEVARAYLAARGWAASS